jgi:hypothetical protein
MFIFGTKNDVIDEFKVLMQNLSFMQSQTLVVMLNSGTI